MFLPINDPDLAKRLGYDWAKLTDDRRILRRECGVDLIKFPVNRFERTLVDDGVTLALYVSLRRGGQAVKGAGIIATEFRAAMRQFPDADELIAYKLSDGSSFIRPSGDKGYAAHARAGCVPVFELVINVRSLRAYVVNLAGGSVVEAAQPESVDA